MTNILYHEGKPYVTDKETFPTKPECEIHSDYGNQLFANEVHQLKLIVYENAVADFIRDCTPIREEDQREVQIAIWQQTDYKKQILFEHFKPVDHTIYKVDIELEEIEQWKYMDIWVEENRDDKDAEYRRAFKIVETKEESKMDRLKKESWIRNVMRIEGKTKEEAEKIYQNITL
jgi:hypothetical protein